MRFRFVLCVTLLFLLTGCAREKEQSSDAIDVDLKTGTACLSGFGAQMSRYFKAQMTRLEVESLWTCVSESVETYHRLTLGEGQNGDLYRPEAVRNFLQKYFIKQTRVSDSLLSSLMEIKRVVVSGQTDALTRQEILRLLDFLNLLKSISLQLNPHVATLFTDLDASDAEMVQAGEEFIHVLGRLGAWLDANGQPYAYSHLTDLFRELKTLARGRDQIFGDVERVLAILPSAKSLLLSGSRQGIGGQEWGRLLRTVARGYDAYNKARRAIRADINSGLSRYALADGLESLRWILSDAVQARVNGHIEGHEWRDFLFEMEKAGLLPSQTRAEPLYQMWIWFNRRMLGSGNSTGTLTLHEIKSLKRPIELWREILDASEESLKPGRSDRGRFAEVLAAGAPQQWDAQGRLLIELHGPASWTVSDKKRVAWPFAVLTWIKEAYVGRTPDKLDQAALNLAVSEILPRLQAFGWLTSTKPTIGLRLMREANLFTLSSDGSTELEMHEAVRYLIFVASALRSADLWLQQADQKCGHRRVECVRQVVQISEILSPLPRLKGLIESRDHVFFEHYMKQAEETVLGQVQRGEYAIGNLLQVWMVFQYVETFLRRYDVSKNETIELSESLEAFVTYGPTLGRLLPGGQMPPDEVLAFFTFMMNYGETPFGMFGGQVIFNHWRWHRDQWLFSADRETLMAILNQLSKL